MWGVLGFWIGSAIACLLLALFLGLRVLPRKSWFGILIDMRGRCSLAHFQLFLWSVVILSLIAGVAFGRLIHGVNDPLDFKIPGEVLGLLGISIGSAATATAIKATKDVTGASKLATLSTGANGTLPSGIAAKGSDAYPPRLAQIFLLEEGQYADQAIDIGKYQNFIFTVVLVVAYVALSVHAISKQGGAISALPSFSDTFLVLVGISQAGYIANKIPNQAGIPPSPAVGQNQVAADARAAAIRHAAISMRALQISQAAPANEALTNWLQAEGEIDGKT